MNTCNHDHQEDFVAIRHWLHRRPEIGSETPEAAAMVASCLERWGYEVHRNIGGHGLVGVLRGAPGEKRLGLRADMDALPMQENNRFPHASEIPGRMHACGHDGHTAILLAAAYRLAKARNFRGTLNLIFQPDEEGLSGAKAMIEDGLFTRFPCDAIYALHNAPGYPVGSALVQTGPTMASSSRVTLRIAGKGGHGAMPEKAINPISVIASLTHAIESIKATQLSVSERAVISIGMVQAGTVYNIIPNDATMLIGVRTDTLETLTKIRISLEQIVKGHEQLFGVHIEWTLEQLAPVLVNHPAEAEILRNSLAPLFDPQRLRSNAPIIMSTEDFAWMLQEVPGCYFMLGNGEGEYHGCSVHNPHYDFNDELVRLGADCWVKLTEDFLV